MTTIHACPFCGHDDVEIDEVGVTEYAVTCPECRCIGPITGDIMGAIAAWNGSVIRDAAFIALERHPETAA